MAEAAENQALLQKMNELQQQLMYLDVAVLNLENQVQRLYDDMKKTGPVLDSNVKEYMDKTIQTFADMAPKLKDILQLIWTDIDSWEKDRQLNITEMTKYDQDAIPKLDKLCTRGNQLFLGVLEKGKIILDIFRKLPCDADRYNVAFHDIVSELQNKVMKDHLKRIFIVDKNPQRILKLSGKTSSVFSMSVCILGGDAFTPSQSDSTVSAKLFQEADMSRSLLFSDQGFCEVTNGENKFFDRTDNADISRWVAHFQGVQLKKVSLNPGKKALVTDLKFWMVFSTQIRLLGNMYPLQAVSQPMVLKTHASQECMAKFTLIWNAAFSYDVREPQSEAKHAKWEDVAKVLNTLFFSRTGLELPQDQIDYLAQIAFKCENGSNLAGQTIQRSQIIRDKLRSGESFWKWFESCLNVISMLKEELKAGLIYCFISKTKTREILMRKRRGTFLIRFSESKIDNSQSAEKCGFLIVAVKEKNPDTGEDEVFFIDGNLTSENFHKYGLAPTLDGYQVADVQNGALKHDLLQFVWPDTPFQQVIRPFIVEIKKKKVPTATLR